MAAGLKSFLFSFLITWGLSCFVVMLATLAFTTISAYPLSIFFQQDVICEIYTHSYKPGQNSWIYEFYLIDGDNKIRIHTLTQVAISGLFYIPFVMVIFYFLTLKHSFQEIKSTLLERNEYSFIKALKSLSKDIKPDNDNLLVLICCIGIFYFANEGGFRQENIALYQQWLDQKLAHAFAQLS